MNQKVPMISIADKEGHRIQLLEYHKFMMWPKCDLIREVKKKIIFVIYFSYSSQMRNTFEFTSCSLCTYRVLIFK